VVLTLTGRRNDVDLSLTRTLNLGSKAIGVFGNVRQGIHREIPATLVVNSVIWCDIFVFVFSFSK